MLMVRNAMLLDAAGWRVRPIGALGFESVCSRYVDHPVPIAHTGYRDLLPPIASPIERSSLCDGPDQSDGLGVWTLER